MTTETNRAKIREKQQRQCLMVSALHYHQEHGTSRTLELLAGLIADAMDSANKDSAKLDICLAGDEHTTNTQWTITCDKQGYHH